MRKLLPLIVAMSLAAPALTALGQAAAPAAAPAAAAPAPAPDPRIKDFEALAQTVQQNPANVTEAQVLQLLQLAKDLGRPYTAHIALRAYLNSNLTPSAPLLLASAENADLAGDYRTAVSRYKAYLKNAPAGPATSKAAATLYLIQIDFLNSADDAYDFMNRFGGDLRQSAEARRFDSWFLNQAAYRKDYAGMATRLAQVMADGLPVEQERLFYWENLDWLMPELSRAKPEQFGAVAPAKKIVSLIREDAGRTARYGFIVAHLEYRANSVGKEQAVIDKNFEPVIASARAYFTAFPNADTLHDILQVLLGGYWERNDQGFNLEAKAIRGFFVESFPKLSDPDKKGMINWVGIWNYQATPEQWVELGAGSPAAFKTSPQTATLPFLVNLPDVNVYKKETTFLTGVPSNAAAIANALGTGAGLDVALNHLYQNEMWYQGFDQLNSTAASSVWPIWNSFPKDAAHPLPANYFASVYLPWAAEHVAKSPVALFDPTGVKNYLMTAWSSSGVDGNDKSQVATHLHNLDWVPWDDKGRKDVIGPVYDEFKKWADQVRQQMAGPQKAVTDTKAAVDAATAALAAATADRDKAAAADKPAKEAVVTAKTAELKAQTDALAARQTELATWDKIAAQITPLEGEFKKALDTAGPGMGDPTKVADPLAQKLALCVKAIQAKKLDQFLPPAREAYALVRDFADSHKPFGAATVYWLIANRLDAFDTIDFQCEVIADQIAQWKPDRLYDSTESVLTTAIWGGRPGWSWWAIPIADKDKALKFNATITKAMVAQMDAGKFNGRLFDYHRATRRGQGWQEQDIGKEALAKMITTKVLLTNPYRVTGGSAVGNYVWLIRNEYQGLATDFPVERYFDDMFIQEASANHWLDMNIFYYSRDEAKKLTNFTADVFATFTTLPFGYNVPPGKVNQPLAAGGVPVYTRNDFWQWQARALGADKPQRDAMLAKIEGAYGTTRFDDYAMGRSYFSTDANTTTPPGRKLFFDKLAAYLDKAKASPGRVSPPYMSALPNDPKGLTDAERKTLLSIFDAPAPQWAANWYFENLATLLLTNLAGSGNENALYGLAPHLWKIGHDTNNVAYERQVAQAVRDLEQAGKHDVAAVLSESGLDMLGTDLPEDARTALMSAKSAALQALGGTIPVNPADPRWPMFSAQVAFSTGKLQTAWDGYSSHAAMVPQMYKELDPNFVVWLIQQNTETRNFDRAKELSQAMITWIDSAPQGFEPEVNASVQLAFADIAMAQKEYAQARALYERIASAKEFDGTQAKRQAELKVAEVDRVTRNYDRALDLLDRLSKRPDKVLQAEAYYQMAMVKTDQELYTEASALLEQVFQRVPNHVEARILDGKLDLFQKKLESATLLRVGPAGEEKFLIPGKPLRVELEDKNLAIVGAATNIEIRAWTSSGDEEFFNLFPSGDSKTRFVGQINTEMGVTAKGDHVLQVLGGDTIRYAFSDKMDQTKRNALGEPPAMMVVTDAELFASSGKILTKEELENRAMERMIRSRLRLDEGMDKQLALNATRSEDQIKPGNKINIRINDPDRNTTPQADMVKVKVSTSSGDSLTFQVKETGPFTGIFEGSLPTSGGQATAYASDSTEGHDANWVISAKGDVYWQGLADNVRPKTFNVDLNDNVALGKLGFTAAVPGRKLKDVMVQTSINGRDFGTVARWPGQFEPWDGSPRIELVRYFGMARNPSTLEDYQSYLNGGYFVKGSTLISEKVETLSTSLDANLNGRNQKLGLDGVSDWYVGHWYGAFFMPRTQVRTFKLDTKGRVQNLFYIMTVDGKPAQAGQDPTQVSRSLVKGVHRIDIYVFGYRHAGAQFEVLMDSDQPPFMVPAPAEMFDPAKHPEIRRAVMTDPATLTPNADGTHFDVAFAPGSRARVLRLLIADYETDAPAINKMTLSDADGKAILPTAQDFITLKQNDQLEIVPGDRIAVTYEDPTVITKNKSVLETFMTATFSNAELSAAFVEYYNNEKGERTPKYIPMRRFKPGDTIKVFIKDPDMDTTDKPDVIKFTAKTPEGSAVELDALETDDHTGVFLGTVFPVAGAPQRPSEVKVQEADDLTLSYMDKENTDPGIPWERTYVVEQTWSSEPEIRAYDVSSRPLNPDEIKAAAAATIRTRQLEETVAVTREMIASRPAEQPTAKKPATAMVDGPLMVEVLAPQIAQSPRSRAEIYVQTEAGREKYGKEPQGAFDLNVPGTIKLHRFPGDPTYIPTPPGYRNVLVRGNPYAALALDDGRYTFLIGTEMGAVPDKTGAFDEYDEEKYDKAPILRIRGSDKIYIGFQYNDAAGKPQWLTQTVNLGSDVFFDVMDRRYQQMVDGVHVGENLYFRVIQKIKDKTDDKDALTIELATSKGKTKTVTLTETFGHSGVFKGLIKLVYLNENPPPAKAPAKAGAPGAATQPAGESENVGPEQGTLEVAYGDQVVARYAPGGKVDPMERSVLVFKGGDGAVVPFTKRFKDPEIAVQTQFTVAEAWFELAKRHRDLDQETLARKEIDQGKKLLEEAIRDYPNTEARAQADYLLANLSFEFAKDAQDPEVQRKHYMEAITRFSDIVASYPDSEYAPKSQYKKALVLEKTGQIDQACEEYVKLSYRYPDNELVAETIARLGQYFLAKGKEFDQKADAQTDPVEREKVKMQGQAMFTTAAQVFGRLSERFPQHALADKTRVLSAQCYLRAKDLDKAIQVFKSVYEDTKVDKDLAAESMYWAGDAHMQRNDAPNAYRAFKKLTWDYPESKWAKFARGRLTEESLIRVQDQDTDSTQ